MNLKYDVAIIGGGPAGMAAAVEAAKTGASVCVLERNTRLGGILQQCIHNGFGLHYFKEELTGPEYAARFIDTVAGLPIKIYLDTMVIGITADKVVTAINPDLGNFKVEAKAVVLAMGCRERSAGAIMLAGTRPAGVYTAGAAQRIVNLEGHRIGKKIVILGSGDIGLIMARRMTYEGAKVEAVAELMSYSAGLKRNIVQCLDDYGIPLYFSTTVTRVVGKTKLEGVYLAPVDEKMRPILEKEWFIECDTLLLSVGLIPENDLILSLNMKMDAITSGAVVNQHRETSISGIFSAGNVLHVHDLVDNVSEEAEEAGRNAARFALGKTEKTAAAPIPTKGENGVRYVLPQFIEKTADADKVRLYFRVDNMYKTPAVEVVSGDTVLMTKRYAVLAPGEMEDLTVSVTDIKDNIIIRLKK